MAQKKSGLFSRLISFIPTKAKDAAKEVAKHGASAAGVGVAIDRFRALKEGVEIVNEAIVEKHSELVAEATSFMDTHLNPNQQKKLSWIKEPHHFSKLGAMLYSFKNDQGGSGTKPSLGKDKELTRAEQRFVVWLRGLSENTPKRGAQKLNGIPVKGDFMRSFEESAAKATQTLKDWESPSERRNKQKRADDMEKFALRKAHAEAENIRRRSKSITQEG